MFATDDDEKERAVLLASLGASCPRDAHIETLRNWAAMSAMLPPPHPDRLAGHNLTVVSIDRDAGRIVVPGTETRKLTDPAAVSHLSHRDVDYMRRLLSACENPFDGIDREPNPPRLGDLKSPLAMVMENEMRSALDIALGSRGAQMDRADELGDLHYKVLCAERARDELLRENAMLRRTIERLERKARR